MKNQFKFVCTLVGIALFLIGCASAVIPDPEDPMAKIEQAYKAMRNDRPQAAVQLLNEARTLAKKQKNREVEAQIERTFGDLYKNPGPFGQELADPNKAMAHYSNAASIYNQLKLFKNESLMHWGAASTFMLLKDTPKACGALAISQQTFWQPDASPRDHLPEQFAGGKLMQSVKNMRSALKCGV